MVSGPFGACVEPAHQGRSRWHSRAVHLLARNQDRGRGRGWVGPTALQGLAPSDLETSWAP